MKDDHGKAIAWRSVSCKMTCYHESHEKNINSQSAFCTQSAVYIFYPVCSLQCTFCTDRIGIAVFVQACLKSGPKYWSSTGQFLYGKAKRSFRDWPFVCFSGGFISHLFGDYANIIMWELDYSVKIACERVILLRTIVAAFFKTKCNGRFGKNKRYQETGKEYFTIVQMTVKDEGY